MTSQTPIFDTVMADFGVDLMPPPAFPTHEDFLREHGHQEFLARADAILRGTEVPARPAPAPSPLHGLNSVPVKRKR